MAMTRSGLRDRIARLERRSVEQVADVIAELHQRTGLSIKAIVDEAERMAEYYRMHGEWPPAVREAVEAARPGVMTIHLAWDDPDVKVPQTPDGRVNSGLPREPAPEPPAVAPVERHEPPVPEPETETDADLEATVRQLVEEVRRRLRP